MVASKRMNSKERKREIVARARMDSLKRNRRWLLEDG